MKITVAQAIQAMEWLHGISHYVPHIEAATDSQLQRIAQESERVTNAARTEWTIRQAVKNQAGKQ